MLFLSILGIDWHIWLTVILILGMFVSLLKTRIPTDIVFLAVMALLVVTGCLDAKEAISSFGDSSVVIIGSLFFVIAGLEATGVLQWSIKHLLGTPRSTMHAIAKLMFPVAFLSAFLSNTTVVALFVKVVKLWAKKLKIAPSKLLIPLSYAAGMGGVCTLIGTPPNLIIHEFYQKATNDTLGIFITTIPGLFCLAVGVISIMLLQRLLPTRITPEERLNKHGHEAVTEIYVPKYKVQALQTVGDLRLSESCPNSELIGIIHFDGVLEHITPESNLDEIFIMGGDTFLFAGERDEIISFAKRHNLEYDIDENTIEVKQGKRTLLSTAIMLAMVILSALDVLPLLNSCFIAAMLMLVTRCCKISDVKKSISWDVLMVFACSIAIGKAIDSTGLATMLANGMSGFCGSNALMAFIIVCTLGTFVTEFISNTACGAIMAPIALELAEAMGANPLTFIIGLMISVSSSFATPIGSPTHLLVYVPGGYRFIDFVRIGLPMNFIILAANIFITLMLFPL